MTRRAVAPQDRRTGKEKQAERLRALTAAMLDGSLGVDGVDWIRRQEKTPGTPFSLGAEEGEARGPLSYDQARRLIRTAKALIADLANDDERKAMLGLHVARRDSLYAAALADGDRSLALAVLKDAAELLGLYPPKRTEHTGANGADLPSLNAVVLAIIQAEANGQHEQEGRARPQIEGNGVGGPPVPALADLLRDDVLQDPGEP